MPYRLHRPGLRPEICASLVDASVDAFWSFEGTGDGHRVLPDGCMDFLFDLTTERASIVGAMSRAEIVDAPPGARVFGARFRPGRAALFVDATAAELRDTGAPLDTVLGAEAARLTERVLEARTDAERALVLAEFVQASRSRVRPNDARLDRATRLLEEEHGAPAIRAVAASVGLSERQLERLFSERVGVRPKLFARVQRMRHAMGLMTSIGSSGSGLAAAAGYSDESHLLREFRTLCGVVPAGLARDVGFVQSPASGAGQDHPP